MSTSNRQAITNPRSDVRRIVAVLTHCQPPALRDVYLEYDSDAFTFNYSKNGLMVHPGEYLTHLRGRRDGHRVRSLTIETSLGRQLCVGYDHAGGTPFVHAAPPGHELRALTTMYDPFRQGILQLRPLFVPRKFVATDFLDTWTKLLNKIHKKAAKCSELPTAEVEGFLRSMRTASDRLVALDARGVVSPVALAATFDDLLKLAYQDVFARRNAFARVLIPSASVTHRRDALSKLSQRLHKLLARLADPFELAERQFLTDASFREGADVEPLVLRFAAQPVSCYNCDTALVVFHHHEAIVSSRGLDFVARLMSFLVATGDLTTLQGVVALYGKRHNQTPAQVFKSWEHSVPAIRLALRYRRLRVLQWLVLDVGLVPDDASPDVPLDAHSDERLWTIDQLLQPRGRPGDDERLTNCRRLVEHVRNARAFQERTQALIARNRLAPVHPPEMAALVPLITHAFDLKWFFTFADTFVIPDAEKQKIFADAFLRVLSEELVLDDLSRIFFKRAFKNARRLGYLTQDDAFDVKADYAGARVRNSQWFRELQQQVRSAVQDVSTAQSRLNTLNDSLQRLQMSLKEHALRDEERRVRKQLLATVSSLLPMVAPAFSLLEQCLSHSDPLAFVVAIVDGVDDADLQDFLSGNEPPARLPLQEGLRDALDEVGVNPQDLLEILRDVIKDDNNQRDTDSQQSGEQAPAGDDAAPSTRPPRLREVVRLYMAQRRELEQAMRESISDDYERISRMSLPRASELATEPPTWQSYIAWAQYLPWSQ